MQVVSGTKKKNRASVAKIASESFAGHRLVPEQTASPIKMWYCGRKDTGMYSYRVIAAPNMILVYGDVGDYMLQAYDRDLIPWLREAIKSEGYLIGKMINKREVFLPDEADALLTELYEEYERDDDLRGQQRIIQVRNNWDKDYDGLDKFGNEMMSVDEPFELINCAVDYESDVYWTVECLKKFIELLDESEANAGFGTCSSLLAAA